MPPACPSVGTEAGARSLLYGIGGWDVLVWVEIVVVWVVVAIVPNIVVYRALGAPVNSSAKAVHPIIDRRRPVLAHVGDDGRLAFAKNESRLDGRLLASVRATGICHEASDASRCSANTCSPSGANRCARRSRQSAQQGANANANGGSQGWVGLLGVDLELAQVVTMDYRSSMYRDFSVVVELPECVQSFVSLA